MSVYKKAKQFIDQNARPLDLARWQFHFESGSREAVIKALSAYQNEDGGFGHALENDYWNPNSSPIQTWTATKTLQEVGCTDENHPMIKGILKYLSNGEDFNGRCWYPTVPTNNDYPHAPWWRCDVNFDSELSYNPTASLAGFLLRFGKKEEGVFEKGLRIAEEAIVHLLNETNMEMHELGCYSELFRYCEEDAAIRERINFSAFQAKLMDEVNRSLERDPSKWQTTYCCTPSWFIKGKDSIFYSGNEELCECECDLLIKTQLENGAWAITWKWDQYPDEFAISANRWQSNGIIDNLLFLDAFGYADA